MAASLMEDLRSDLVRLHPLVREFAVQQMPQADRGGSRWIYGARLIAAYDKLAVLEEACARRGIDAVEQDLLTGLGLLDDSASSDPLGILASSLFRAVRQEGHTLRNWDASQDPASFREQWLKRAILLREDEATGPARAFLRELPSPYLELLWTTAQRETSLVRTLFGHADSVCTVAVAPDGRRVVSGAKDDTLPRLELSQWRDLAHPHRTHCSGAGHCLHAGWRLYRASDQMIPRCACGVSTAAKPYKHFADTQARCTQ